LLSLRFSSARKAFSEKLQLTDKRDAETGIGRQEKIIARRAARPQR
jgi:hypothetical protein